MVYHPTIHWPPPLSPLHYRLDEGWVLLLLMKLALPRYQSSRESTHHLQAISLILFTVLETFVFLITELLYIKSLEVELEAAISVKPGPQNSPWYAY